MGLVLGAQGCARAYAQAVPDGGPGGAADAASPPPAADAAAPSGPTYSGPPPWFNLRPPHVTAGMSAESVARVVRQNQAGIVQCYTTQLATTPQLHGLLSLRIQVIAGGFGSIDRSRFAPRNADLEGCVQTALGPVSWPNPAADVASTEIDLEIDLAPTPPPARHH